MANELYVKRGGSWQVPENIYVKDAGTWKPVQFVWRKEGGTWRRHWPSSIPFEYSNSVLIGPISATPPTRPTFFTFSSWTPWSPYIDLSIPTNVLSNNVAFLTGASFDYSFNPRGYNDDTGFDDQPCTLTGRAYYSTLDGIPSGWYVDHTAAVEVGPYSYGPVKYGISGGALYASNAIPDNRVVTGIRIRHYHGVFDDDSINAQYKAAEFYIKHAPVVTDGTFVVNKGATEFFTYQTTDRRQLEGAATASAYINAPLGATPSGFYFENRSFGYNEDDDIGVYAKNRIGVGFYWKQGEFIIP